MFLLARQLQTNAAASLAIWQDYPFWNPVVFMVLDVWKWVQIHHLETTNNSSQNFATLVEKVTCLQVVLFCCLNETLVYLYCYVSGERKFCYAQALAKYVIMFVRFWQKK